MRLLILGTGGMANAHATAFAAIPNVELVGGVDTNADRLKTFSDKFGIENRFTSLADALKWGDFHAVANVTPDPAHHPTTMQILAAGKHVFCEKPLATNYALALEMTETAEKSRLVGMVNLTYRNVASLQKAREMVVAGQIGDVKHIEASYLQSWLTQPAWGAWDKEQQWLWRLSSKHGSLGVLGDIGIHVLDFASYAANTNVSDVYCRLKTFHKAPGDQIGEYVLDVNDSFAMSVSFDNGAVGVVHATRFASGHFNDLRLGIYGTKGGLEVTNTGELGTLRASVGEDMLKPIWRDVELAPVITNYQRFVTAVRKGKTEEPSFRRATDIQRVLDLCVQSDAKQSAVKI
jgi:predicted dehydrogenase